MITEKYQRALIHNNTDNNSYSSWELVQHGTSQGSNLCPLFFLLIINDLPTVTSKNAKFVLHADDICIIITSPSSVEFSTKVNILIADINERFRSNLFSSNFDITRFLQF